MKNIILVFCFGLLAFSGMAQEKTNQQLWTDYVLGLTKGINYFEAEFSYQTVFSQDKKWRSLDLKPAYELKFNKTFDLLTSFRLSEKVQQDHSNTFEIRPMLGCRLNFTPEKRIQTNITFRFEHRQLYYYNDNSWDSSNRSRLRLEVLIPINQDTYQKDNLWYAITDYEYFFVIDEELNERFANRTRARLGLGYRHNKHIRFEAIYTRQRSRNQLENGFTTTDHIIRLRLKHYL